MEDLDKFEQFIGQLRLTEERSAKMLIELQEELEKLEAAFKNVVNIRKKLREIHE